MFERLKTIFGKNQTETKAFTTDKEALNEVKAEKPAAKKEATVKPKVKKAAAAKKQAAGEAKAPVKRGRPKKTD